MSSPRATPGAMANAIRALAMDAVQQANSGHPGAPMGMAEMAVALWGRHLKHNPTNPAWPDRDRFVLSNGHASMLLYALLHLSGYDLPIEQLKAFRQLHSQTPGHPEVGVTPGVETTTGPLGQGLANAVGMALAEKLLAAEFNREGHAVVDHFTYVFLGDGCLMEGISHEVCSLAGTLRLSKLIALYDDNGISIDGHVQDWFADDTPERFEAYGWYVIRGVDGHDVAAVDAALTLARAQAQRPDGRPTLICCRTVIGQGAPNKAGTHDVHGAPLGAAEIAAARAALDWPYAPFEIPDDVRAAWDARARGAQAEAEWRQRWQAYAAAYPREAAELQRRWAGELPADFADRLHALVEQMHAQAPTVATRKASQMALEALTAAVPELLGGSADLTGSNLTQTAVTPALRVDASGALARDAQGRLGRHINYGVREFGMAAMMNGIALHGGYIPYGGTFLTFSDYSRNAIRMAALMRQRVIHVLTHDSIGLGEDGPTHQPVEHAASLRLIPHLDVWRPADAAETAVAWGAALQRTDGPTALLLSRQALPALPKPDSTLAPQACGLAAVARGGYIIAEPHAAGFKARKKPKAVLLATGSEVALALQAQRLLAEEGIPVRVVSLPSTTVFDRQPLEYRLAVLPRALPRIAVEAGSPDFWWKYGCAAVVGVPGFGESAPAAPLFELFGLTPANIAATVRAVLAGA